jgi:hypothetical protein
LSNTHTLRKFGSNLIPQRFDPGYRRREMRAHSRTQEVLSLREGTTQSIKTFDEVRRKQLVRKTLLVAFFTNENHFVATQRNAKNNLQINSLPKTFRFFKYYSETRSQIGRTIVTRLSPPG